MKPASPPRPFPPARRAPCPLPPLPEFDRPAIRAQRLACSQEEDVPFPSKADAPQDGATGVTGAPRVDGHRKRSRSPSLAEAGAWPQRGDATAPEAPGPPVSLPPLQVSGGLAMPPSEPADQAMPGWLDLENQAVLDLLRRCLVQLKGGAPHARAELTPRGLAHHHALDRFVRFHQLSSYFQPDDLGRLMRVFLEGWSAGAPPWGPFWDDLSDQATRPLPGAALWTHANFAGTYVYARGVVGGEGRKGSVRARDEVMRGLEAQISAGVVKQAPPGLHAALHFAVGAAGRRSLAPRQPPTDERARKRQLTLLACFRGCLPDPGEPAAGDRKGHAPRPTGSGPQPDAVDAFDPLGLHLADSWEAELRVSGDLSLVEGTTRSLPLDAEVTQVERAEAARDRACPPPDAPVAPDGPGGTG